ncbi:MAG: diguanylate cyclase [Paraglaciecola sp.]|uniref:GGDEF domain-containing response regulator n=1 Tax=Pseudomonadati TaxID=3379134 RepID=UPI00273DAC23|nr:diguanylate cyclase [Paraglaciecola sp.]MDP5029424.1 diguanylate cyclase [Paraglaciecola sp.]MDP5133011.1 diguanylate cyclase [Paraglaciecola sp.]
MLELLSAERTKPHILLVDDQSSSMVQLNEIFKHDYEVFMTTDEGCALELCKKVLPDVILLDVMMPSINGYELCEQIKATPGLHHIPIIFITASEDALGEVQGFTSGGVDYVHKPIDSKIALARVKNQIELKRQSDKLRSLAMVDGLTGIGNRLLLEERFVENWLSSIRIQKPISLLMVDIDNFKKFNDHYGHVNGDECIKRVANAIKTSLERPLDLVARYGGEEFLCILPNTELEGAINVARCILQNVQQLNIPHHLSNAAPVVTVSIGAASCLPQIHDDHQHLLEKADQHLYKAKSSGKNTVCAT